MIYLNNIQEIIENKRNLSWYLKLNYFWKSNEITNRVIGKSQSETSNAINVIYLIS